MQVVLIQLFIVVIGVLFLSLRHLSSLYFLPYLTAFICGSFCVILPTLLSALLWFYTNYFDYQKGILVLFFASILKIFISLALLFICFNALNGKYSFYVIMGFIVSCQGYWLAGLILKKR